MMVVRSGIAVSIELVAVLSAAALLACRPAPPRSGTLIVLADSILHGAATHCAAGLATTNITPDAAYDRWPWWTCTARVGDTTVVEVRGARGHILHVGRHWTLAPARARSVVDSLTAALSQRYGAPTVCSMEHDVADASVPLFWSAPPHGWRLYQVHGDSTAVVLERTDTAERCGLAERAAAAAADTMPYRILAPGRDAVWREGASYVIRWTARRPGRVNIGAAIGGKDKGHLALGIAADADSLRWRIPEGFVTGFGLARSDAVRIRIEDAADPRIGVESAPFTIVGDSR